MKKLICVFMAVLFLMLFASCENKQDPTGINLDEFNQISIGMKLEEVK